MATGFARGARGRGKRMAFGDGRKIIWDHNSAAIFGDRGNTNENPNVARPGDEGGRNLEWFPFYRGNRIYNENGGDRWIWNYTFKAKPGEMFFTEAEKQVSLGHGAGFVLIEPNLPQQKPASVNKQWPVERYREIARRMIRDGMRVAQFYYGSGPRIEGAIHIKTPSFRHALAVLKNASLYIGPEGGLHHGAAAVGVPAVVLFGGFIPPAVTGYDGHANLTGSADEACGMWSKCDHCLKAMGSISVEEVHHAARQRLMVAA